MSETKYDFVTWRYGGHRKNKSIQNNVSLDYLDIKALCQSLLTDEERNDIDDDNNRELCSKIEAILSDKSGNNANLLQSLLREYKINISTTNLKIGDGLSPLQYAAKLGNFSCVQLLLQLGCSPDGERVQSSFGSHTPLSLAAMGGHVKVISSLLASGANISIVNPNSSRCALHYASLGGWSASIKELITSKEKNPFKNIENKREIALTINMQDIYGHTPLHLACIDGDIDSIKVLLEAGADASIIDDDGRNALAIASDIMNRKDIASILIHYSQWQIEQAKAPKALFRRNSSYSFNNNSRHSSPMRNNNNNNNSNNNNNGSHSIYSDIYNNNHQFSSLSNSNGNINHKNNNDNQSIREYWIIMHRGMFVVYEANGCVPVYYNMESAQVEALKYYNDLQLLKNQQDHKNHNNIVNNNNHNKSAIFSSTANKAMAAIHKYSNKGSNNDDNKDMVYVARILPSQLKRFCDTVSHVMIENNRANKANEESPEEEDDPIWEEFKRKKLNIGSIPSDHNNGVESSNEPLYNNNANNNNHKKVMSEEEESLHAKIRLRTEE
eukprot:gene9808-13199_t